MDFTLEKYNKLLNCLLEAGYKFLTFHEYLLTLHDKLPEKFIILRHDVDLLPKNSLRFAKIQASLGIKGSYYFRAVKQSWDEQIIQEIYALGHEIGYHYENLTTCKGNIDKAYEDFCHHLARLRQLVPVHTICMHGSPQSKYDSKDIWKKYNYKELNIIGEPYFDVNFEEVFYLTDTGRRWDGMNVSIRDNVAQQQLWKTKNLVYHSTNDIINAILNNTLPLKIMFTFHPQRWHDNILLWTKELCVQNLKNIVKYFLKIKRETQYLSIII